ncbi:retroelement silencing factor 1 isoform X1 [Pantherophis guttatus]|uniref:Retroelement silencing factor 1 isoform X1 n=1 Tax=Pantherophis guttatus TaxID=94885 RepID=A0A6P9AP81_PANGU|nr:retroelement silencing factor 1 isoform X1 [Pantherophis guttatus]XP_034259263.1 retroelement silencing factor 1 isoform X1 [Pantherophis guttatus]XP_034259264.1 retroelement silencing factor 1 isoform X1 [Pantherophis guttatus]XP_034259265.1 retroelement silencing factor 1 isoform X1 [Pantherophis guttatus]XP_060550479.1 retroelement silencing factor 1 isoform X1 [Pantherophis guttatus]
MDWNVGTINKMQTSDPFLMPQVPSAASITSQTNVLMQNFCNSGNSQTTNIPSSMKYMLTNKRQFRNNRASKNLRPVFPKVAVSRTSFGLNNNFYKLSPSSLSTMTVEMAADVQNPNLSRNMQISSSLPLQGSTVNSVQNMHQKTNAYMAVGSFSNQTLQNCSNSMGTSVYQQDPLNTSSPKRAPTQMPYYYMNGPATSQADARVSLNSASNYYLSPQQNVQYPDYCSAKKCPNSAIPVTMQSQTYASDQVIPPPYPIYSHYNYRNTVQATNINSSLSDLMVPIQANHGQFVLQQPTAILSNEKVESYHNTLIDQNSNLYSVRPDQKSQSLSSCTETNVVGPTAYNVSGPKTTMQLSNESVKSYVEAEGNFSNSIPTTTTVKVAEPLQQTNQTLQLEKNISNENLSKDKVKITRESLSLDVQALYEMRNALLKLKENFNLKQKIYLSSLQSGQTPNTSVNNQNPNLFSHNTNPSVECTAQPVLSDKVTPNQFSSNSHNSSVVPQKTKYHLLPILWNLLKGTDDENMLFNADVEGGDKYQNKHFIVQDNSSTDSNDDAFGNPVNTDGTTKLSYKISPVGSTQGTNIIKSAHNQLEKISTVPNSDLLNSSEQNKNSESGGVQYLNDSIQSLVKNSDVSQESSSMKNSIKEEHGNSTPACHIQHGENTCLQKQTNSEKIADTFSSSISKGVEAVTGTPGLEVTLEELKTSLALWRKCLPKSLNELLNRNTESSSDGIDGKGPAKILENLPNILTQNYDTKITVERTQIYGSSSFEKNLDGVNSNLPKGSEPQVAVVTPRILSKNNDVQKNNEIINPATDIEEGTVHTLEKVISTKSDSNEEKRTIYSPTDSYKYCDLNVHQGTDKSTGKNKIVKAEVGTNHTFDLNQEKTNSSPLGLKEYDLNSGVQHQCELITNDLTASSQKCVTSKKHAPNLDESNNTAEVGLKDSMLQISSVCTLVQGDAFYNSQIADIFSTSLLKPGIKLETSGEHMPSLQHNEDESGLLKNDPEVGMSLSEEGGILLPSGSLSKTFTGKPEDLQTLESPQCDKTSVETNASNSEKQKNNDFLEVASLSGKKIEQDISYGCNTDLSNNEMFENQESLCETNNMSSIRKAGDLEHTLDEGKEAHLGSSTESSATFLNNQLTELSKEFPYGIGYLNMVKEIENKDSRTMLPEREDKENTMSHEKSLDPSDAVEQIKIVILNSQQMSEVFPECRQQSSNKLDNHGGDQMRMDSKHKDVGHYRKSNEDLNVDSKVIKSERLGKPERTYCCLPGWLASKYNVEPCSCMLAKEPSLKEKTDLYSQSKERSKSSESDCSLKNEVQNSILDTGNNIFLLGDQSNKALNKTFGCKETEPQVKEDKLPKLEQATTPRSSLKNSNSQEPKKRGKKLSHSADSQSLQRERVGTNKIRNQKNGRRNISKSEAQYHLNRDFKKIIIKKLAKKKLEKKSFNKTLKSKIDTDRHRGIETKNSINFEKYKIKRDTSETHVIKGPISSRSLKRQMMKETNVKGLETQPSEVMPSSTLNSVSFASEKHENSEHNSTLGSQVHLNKTKLKGLEKQYGYKKVQYNEPICPKQRVEQNLTQLVKRINLEKYAYRKDKKNECQSSHFDNRIPASQNERDNPSNEVHSPVKEGTLDSSNPDKWSVKSLSDKKCFKRKNKHTVFLQKEQKKNYLNRVAFKRTAQKTIRLTSLDSVHSKPLWHVKSNNGTEDSEPHQKGSSSSQMSEAERPQMLEFKMCPEILFRKSTSEEQTLEATKLPEKNRISVTAVKSKREDWLNYCPVKRRKTEENEIQVNDEIPLDAAIKILEGNEVFHGSMKDSKATFETYRKMHLEKRSRSLDSSPIS